MIDLAMITFGALLAALAEDMAALATKPLGTGR